MAAERGATLTSGNAGAAPPPTAGAAADLIALAMAVLVPLSLHFRALTAPFFADDWLFLDQVRRQPLWQLLSSADPLGNYFRPVSRAVWFTLVDRVGGGTPFAFHAMNLSLFVVSGLMLYALTRRLAGRRAALVALALFLPTACADVPIAWAAGSQDLLALMFSLGGLLLWIRGARVAAALVFLCGALSKEVALVMPWVAVLLDSRPRASIGDRLRAAWPLAAMFALWGGLWFATRALRPAAGHELDFDPTLLGVAFARLPQAFLGLEWAPGTPFRWLTAWPAAGTLTLAGLFALLRQFASPQATAPRGAIAGFVWAALATLPIVAVAAIWSSYFLLLAVAGLALALGAATQRWPDPALALLVLLVTLGAQHARMLPVFATERGPWTSVSHVNGAYLKRSATVVSRLLTSMQRQRPRLAPASTVFFAQVPVSAGFQMGDGALLRIAYRDTSLRSYFLTDFSSARAARGPLLFFVAEGDTLRDHTNDPLVVPSLVYSMIVSDRPQAALDALDLARAAGDDALGIQAWRTWPLLALGRREEALSLIRATGGDTSLARPAELEELRAVSGDTLAQIARLRAGIARHALDPRLHSRLAQLLMTQPGERTSAVVATYAVRTLTPRDPGAWRNFAVVQLAEGRSDAARSSLERYFRLGGVAATRDTSAHQVYENLRREASAVRTEEPQP